MPLQPLSSQALDHWIKQTTWTSGHPCDEGRFYDFVNAYEGEHGSSLDEVWLREIICARIGVSPSVDDGEEFGPLSIVNKHISLMYCILEFLEKTGR